MKTLLVYLKARLTGKKITWIDAQYAAININVEDSICNGINNAAQSVLNTIETVERGVAFLTHYVIERPVVALGRFLISCFAGRLFICIARGQLDVDYVFYGVVS